MQGQFGRGGQAGPPPATSTGVSAVVALSVLATKCMIWYLDPAVHRIRAIRDGGTMIAAGPSNLAAERQEDS